MNEEVSIQDLNEMFKVKVKHKIYSFYTNTIPDFMKIGDTYRQVAIRLNEWKRVYKNLRPNQIFDANINNEAFFRDLAVHQYLRIDKNKHIVTPEEVKGVTAFCTELFGKDVDTNDIIEAIDDIKSNYGKANSKYVYYKLEGNSIMEGKIERVENYKMRPNQEETVKNFIQAVESGRRNLLMYAVMRFGKSFTAMQCAKAYSKNHKLKLIVITSAKKDVGSEWKNTVYSHIDFEEFEFITDNDLAENYNKIKEVNDNGKVAVVFLTLQVLNKKKTEERHKQVLESDVDLLFVDETHYGARATKLGKVLDYEDSFKGEVNWKQVTEETKKVKDKIHAKINLHLSGTPYNILKTDEFEEKDIIAFCQFSDIAKEKETWQNKLEKGDEELAGQEAWDNPYFGFPQMIRFAFNISDESKEYLEAMSEKGMEYFAGLFNTKSDDKNNPEHKIFVNEEDVLRLFKVIDGSQEGSEMLAFLEYEGIKAAELCRHMVFVMPRRSSCDALEKLLKDHAKEFKNLGEYEIINISGLDSFCKGNNYTGKVKAKIEECEKRNKRTISLTVNKMLTGTTVKEWDSMLYFKDTQSAQEYDQATFRIQNPYIEKSVGIKNGKEYEIKIDKKPQTLLVDFKPARMFYMQAYNIDKLAIINRGNESIDFEKIAKSRLTISPIICLNKDKLQKIDEKTIVDTITNYMKDRSVMDETVDMVISEGLLSNKIIDEMLKRYPQLDAKTGIKHDPNKDGNGEKKALDEPDVGDKTNGEDNGNSNDKNAGKNVNNKSDSDKEYISALRRRFNACIAKLLFYVFISGEKYSNIEDVINSLDRTERNKRISANFRVNKEDLILLNKLTQGYDKNSIIKAIVKMSTLANDENLTAIERVQTAIKKFNRFSSAEIVTPYNICTDMLNCIGVDKLAEIVNNGNKILDIASKAGEFSFAVYNLLKGKVDDNKLKNAIYAIPTSKDAYEFTRYIYENIGLNVSNIADKFTSFDLLEVKDQKGEIDYDKIKLLLIQDKPFKEITLQDEVKEGDRKVKFDAIVGNPPYTEEVAKQQSLTNGQARRSSIFQYFQSISDKMSQNAVCLIYPGVRWLHRSGKGMSKFGLEQINDTHLELLHFYQNANEVFNDVSIADGITIVYKNINKKTKGFNYIYHNGSDTYKAFIDNPGEELLVLNPKDDDIILKVKKFVDKNKLSYISKRILSQKLFGIESDFVETNSQEVKKYSEDICINLEKEIKLLANDKAGKAGRSTWYIANRNVIKVNEKYIDEWQVVVSSANAGGQKRSNQLEIIDNNSAFGRSRVALASFKTEIEAKNFYKYCKTYLIRFMFLMTDEALTSLGKMVPDIMDYTGKNQIINFNDNLDRQLYELVDLKENEIKYIEKIIDEKDKINN